MMRCFSVSPPENAGDRVGGGGADALEVLRHRGFEVAALGDLVAACGLASMPVMTMPSLSRPAATIA